VRAALAFALVGWGSAVAGGPAAAQHAPNRSLDGWIVTRYRGAQLLPDSSALLAPLVRSGAAPRVETVRPGRRADTLLAVHVGIQRPSSMLAVGSRATLAGPTGTITPVVAQLLGRRPFRAPRTPGAAVRPDSNWLHGWAYLVVVPHVEGRPSGRYRGWTLLAVPEPAPRRRDAARP
jgi:hypothetical protein